MPSILIEDETTGKTYRVPVENLGQAEIQRAYQRVQQREEGLTEVNPPGPSPPARTASPAVFAEPTPVGGDTQQLYQPQAPSAAPGPSRVEALIRGIGRGVVHMAGKGVLPTVGSLAMEKGGALVPGLRNVPAPLRSSAGSVLGTAANMALGIEEPSLTQLGLAAATPMATETAGQGLRLARRARAAGLYDEVTQLPGVLAKRLGPQTADELFRAAYASNPRIPLTNVQAAAQRIQEAEGRLDLTPSLKHGTQTIAESLGEAAQVAPPTQTARTTASPGGLIGPNGQTIQHTQFTITPGTDGALPLAELDTIRQAIGARIGGTLDRVEKGQLKQLYAAMMRDFEAAARQMPTQDAKLLLEGISTASRQFAIDDLNDLIQGPSGAIGRQRTDGLYQVNFGKILQELERPHRGNELLAQFLDQHPGEKAEIMALLRDMNRRNVKLLPPAGSMFGSGPYLAAGSAAYGAAKLGEQFLGTSMDPSTASAVAIGATAILSRALMTAPGRAIVKEAIAPSGVLNTTRVALQLAGQQLRADYGTPAVQVVIDKAKALEEYGRAPARQR